jgi:hypothetical protein
MGRDDEGPPLIALLQERGTTAREAVLATLDGFDAEGTLLTAGVPAHDLRAVRRRLATTSP